MVNWSNHRPVHLLGNSSFNGLDSPLCLSRLQQPLHHLQIPQRLLGRLVLLRLPPLNRLRKSSHLLLNTASPLKLLRLLTVLGLGLDLGRVPVDGPVGSDHLDLEAGLELGAERDADSSRLALAGQGDGVHRVDRQQTLFQEVAEADDLADVLIQRGEQKAQAGNEVHAAVEEETALVGGYFAPCIIIMSVVSSHLRLTIIYRKAKERGKTHTQS